MIVVVFLCLLAACLAAPDKRIVNGWPADMGEHPHQASLQARYGSGWSHICGGVLIGSRKILTAAHCLDGFSASNLRVQVGAHNLYEPNSLQQTLSVQSYTMHPGYSSTAAGYPNDIGVITLSSSATLNSNVQIAQLAPQGSSFADSECVITGWGRTSGGGSTATVLKEAYITKITNTVCANYWGRTRIFDTHICVFEASLPNGQKPSACNGDSGGPMMCGSNKQYLAGVTSWGVSTCSGEYPSVYTRVSEYVSWVNAQL